MENLNELTKLTPNPWVTSTPSSTKRKSLILSPGESNNNVNSNVFPKSNVSAPTLAFDAIKQTIHKGKRKEKIVEGWVATNRFPNPTPVDRFIEYKNKSQKSTPESFDERKNLDNLEYQVHLKEHVGKSLSKVSNAIAEQQRLQQENDNFKKNCETINLFNDDKINLNLLPVPKDLISKPEFAGSINKRRTYEDAELITKLSFKMDSKEIAFDITALFDGHGGKKAALYGQNHTVQYLSDRLKEGSKYGLTDEVFWNSLKLTSVDLSRTSGCHSEGATSVLVLQNSWVLWIWGLGDSRAILVNLSEEMIFQLSLDQKPAEEKFKKGIENRDGEIIYLQGAHRVYKTGYLEKKSEEYGVSTARGIGDFNLIGAISSRPSIHKHYLDPHKKYLLILVDDGITDVASTNQIGELALRLSKKEQTPNEIATAIVTLASASGSTDNLSAIVRLIKT